MIQHSHCPACQNQIIVDLWWLCWMLTKIPCLNSACQQGRVGAEPRGWKWGPVLSPGFVCLLRLLLSTITPCKMDLCSLQSLCLCKCANILGRAVSRERDSFCHSPGSLQAGMQTGQHWHLIWKSFASSSCLVMGTPLKKAGFCMVFC